MPAQKVMENRMPAHALAKATNEENVAGLRLLSVRKLRQMLAIRKITPPDSVY